MPGETRTSACVVAVRVRVVCVANDAAADGVVDVVPGARVVRVVTDEVGGVMRAEVDDVVADEVGSVMRGAPAVSVVLGEGGGFAAPISDGVACDRLRVGETDVAVSVWVAAVRVTSVVEATAVEAEASSGCGGVSLANASTTPSRPEDDCVCATSGRATRAYGNSPSLGPVLAKYAPPHTSAARMAMVMPMAKKAILEGRIRLPSLALTVSSASID